MSSRRRLLMIFLLVGLLVGRLPGGEAASAARTAATVVSVHPAAATLAAGETLKVEVWVEDVLDLYGADVQLQFDPTAFQVLDANPALPGVQIRLRSDLLKPGIVIKREADNAAGTVWYANSQVYPDPPVSGSGALFEFDLIALKSGDFPLTVTSAQLADINADPISASLQGALYSVQGARIYLPLVMR